MSSITIAIPAYNEAETIGWVIRKTLRDLPKYFADYEIVVVDDGSTDATGLIADRLAKRYQQLRVIYQLNGGYSKAMWAGIVAAKKEYVAYMPADGQFLVPDMANAFALLHNHDLVLGYRGNRSDYNWYRWLLSWGYLILLRLLFGIKYKDVGWVNIWRRKRVQQLSLQPERGIFLLTEIVVEFKRRHWRIGEVSSKYRPRRGGKAKNAKLSVVVNTFCEAWRLWWQG